MRRWTFIRHNDEEVGYFLPGICHVRSLRLNIWKACCEDIMRIGRTHSKPMHALGAKLYSFSGGVRVSGYGDRASVVCDGGNARGSAGD